ncbi:hypothetical protein [Azospirillum sp. sgz301742]
MSADSVFAILLVLLGLGALGGMVVMEVSRLGVLSARRAMAHKRTESMRAETELARTRASQIEETLERGKAQLATLAAECQRLASVTRTVEADRVELVHELGTPDGAPAPYRCVLRTIPDFARIDPRNVIFAREIWQRKNVAHVWAETPEVAHALLQRAFPNRSGVLPGAIERVSAARPTLVQPEPAKPEPAKAEPIKLETAEAPPAEVEGEMAALAAA